MRFLGLLERRIEQLIEGFFARWAGYRVQPFEIRRQLLREMDRGAVAGPGKLVLPNVYHVLLHPEDFAPYRDVPEALIKDFVDALHARAGELGGRFDGPLRVEITVGDGVPPGEIRVEARVHPIEPRPEAPRRPPLDGRPRLRILSDPSGGEHREFALEQGVTTIGREAGHAIVLSDPSVSRTHARIELGPAGATIVDLGSTNGTMLNGQPLREGRAPLGGGDRIQIGTMVLEYLDPPDPP